MGAFLIVVLAPILQFFLGICKAQEPVSIQTFRSEPTVEGFDECVIGGLARSGEVGRDVTLIRPQIQIAGRKLGTMAARIVAGNPTCRPNLSSASTTSAPRNVNRSSCAGE